MNSWTISRRTLLRGAAGSALGLPLLDVMQPNSTRAATAATPPIRLGCLYMPNGMPAEAWKPTAVDGRVTQMSPWATALGPLQNDITFVAGLQSPAEGSHPGAGATWLVRPCPEGDRISSSKNVGSISMDQIVARAVGTRTPFASIELLARPEGSFSNSLLRNNISWRNGTTPVPRETDPRAVFNRLTGQSDAEQALDASATPLRQSVLDAVLQDARSMRLRISAADRHKVDEYLEAVRGVEKRMDHLAIAKRRAARERAAQTAGLPTELPVDHAEYLKLMFDMLVLAYWTDSTRVATFMLDHEQSNRYFNFLPGVKGMWHAISHWQDISGKTEDDDGKTSWSSREVKYQQYLKVIRYHHELFGYFLGRLRDIREGDGSLLDHCMILYGAPFSDGNEHSSVDLPIMIAGKAGGRLKPGRLLERDGAPTEGMYISMMDIMGVKVSEFGGTDEAVALV